MQTRIGWFSVLFSLMVFAAGCNKDKIGNGESTLLAKATYNSTGKIQSNHTVDAFWVNLEEIELEYDEEDDKYEDDDRFEDVELKGPFVVNLLEQGAGMSEELTKIDIPEGKYDELEFKLDAVEDNTSALYEKSVEISGTIDGKPFIFFTDDDFDFELELNNGQSLDINKLEEVILSIEFDLTSLFGSNSGVIDLTAATDLDGDGTIEIHDDDQDGNRQLAEQIEEQLDDITEAYDED